MTLRYKVKEYIKELLSSSNSKAAKQVYNFMASLDKRQKLNEWNKKVRQGQSNFVSIEDLSIWTTEWTKIIPLDYDLIIAIPRCGLLVGTVIAAKAGITLSTPGKILKGEYWDSGRLHQSNSFKRALLVDESMGTGKTIQKHLANIKHAYPDIEIETASLIAHKYNAHLIDHYYKLIPKPLILEWEIFDSPRVEILAVNMEGILCHDYSKNQYESKEDYLKWIKNATPYLIPDYEIDTIILERSEQFREETEKWLKKHSVLYKNLKFVNLESNDYNQDQCLENKIKHLKETRPQMFFENSYDNAKIIWEQTKVPTLSIEKMVLFPINLTFER